MVFKYKNILATALFSLTMLAIACVKTEFDAPVPCDAPDNTVAATSTIAQLLAKHVTSGGYDIISEDIIIKGTIVADDRSGNYYKTVVLQDETGGIEVKFNDGYLASNGFTTGRTMSVKCKGLVLTDYRNLPQLQGGVVVTTSGVPTYVGITQSQRVDVIGKGKPCYDQPTGRALSLGDALQLENLNRLITLTDVQFNKADTSKTYCDLVSPNVYTVANRTLETCGGLNIIMRTSEFSNFATQKTPKGKGTATGILTIYNSTYQFILREPADLKMDGDRCPIGNTGGACVGGIMGSPTTVATVNEAFTTSTVNQDIAQSGWINFSTDGSRKWRAASFQSNNYAQATAFGSSDPSNEAWLIMPAVDVSTQKTLSFESSWSYYKHDGLSLWYATDLDTKDICNANWKPLTATIAQQSNGSGNFGDWIPSGNVALPVISGGKVYVGFRYNGDKTSNTTTWKIDNVKVQ